IEIAESIGIKFPEAYSFLAEAYVGQEKIEDAVAAARQALALALISQEGIGGAWRALGIVAAQLAGPIEIDSASYDVTTCFTAALRTFTEMGAEGERARTLRTWARFELAHGDRARGVAMWREARDIFERLGMTPEIERMRAGY
ncbi:MAG: hypothetical protein GVY30_08440, partial [Chloroflexi bacterium]|nr:hypothetical protein [Chloroflexota bacterium]